MVSEQLVPVVVSLVLKVPERVLERHSAAIPRVVGEELARRVDEYVRREHLGYFPALDFFLDNGGVDEYLLNAARNIAWLAKELAQEEVQEHLTQVFPEVAITAIRSLAFTLPRVLPRIPGARERLARHYTPDTIRVTLLLGSRPTRAPADDIETHARRMLWRWLKDHFSAIEVTSTQVV